MKYTLFSLLLFAVIFVVTTQTISYTVRRVFLRESDPSIVAQNLTTQYIHTFEGSCHSQIPTLLNYQSFHAAHTSDATPQQAGYCDGHPISIFAMASGIEDEDPSTFSCPSSQECRVFNTDSNENAIGGYWSSLIGGSITGVVGNQIAPMGTSDSSKYVSITSYVATQSVPRRNSFLGQQAVNGTSPIKVEYCPGTSIASANFIFKSSACIASPLKNTNRQSNRVTLRPIYYSWKIFADYKAFYAVCQPDNGLIILGCEDNECRDCWLLSDTFGCINYEARVRSSDVEDVIGEDQFYINFQGCGMGRASVRHN